MPTEPQPFLIHPSLDPDDAARQEAYSAIDELIRSALAYHTPERFVELMKFTRRLPKYSPFNCMLLHIQNPNLKYVARPQRWADLGRKIKPGARPLVILAPMHPVMFVFDVSDTEGAPLPPDIERGIEDPFAVEGSMNSTTWNKMESACKRMNIELQDVPLEAMRRRRHFSLFRCRLLSLLPACRPRARPLRSKAGRGLTSKMAVEWQW